MPRGGGDEHNPLITATKGGIPLNPFITVGPDWQAHAPFGVYDSYEAYEETGVLAEHVYIGRPWEHPTAMGCCERAGPLPVSLP